MEYVTHGKVQIKISAQSGQTEVGISPAKDYTIKHKEKSFIIFVSPGNDSQQSDRTIPECVWKVAQDHSFTVEEKLIQPLLMAATNNICLEIAIDVVASKENGCANTKDIFTSKIVAIKIPATL